jgi:hypothetical protein
MTVSVIPGKSEQNPPWVEIIGVVVYGCSGSTGGPGSLLMSVSGAGFRLDGHLRRGVTLIDG